MRVVGVLNRCQPAVVGCVVRHGPLGAEPAIIELGSVADPVQWPLEITLTVTGQPGEHVLFGVVGAGRQDGTPPDEYELSCGTGMSDTHGLFATIPIDEPAP